MSSCYPSCRVVWQLPRVAADGESTLEKMVRKVTPDKGLVYNEDVAQWADPGHSMGTCWWWWSFVNRTLSTLSTLPTSAVLYHFYKDIWVPTFQSSIPIDIYLQGEWPPGNEAWVPWNPVVLARAGKDVGVGGSAINWWKPSNVSSKAVPWGLEEVTVLEVSGPNGPLQGWRPSGVEAHQPDDRTGSVLVELQTSNRMVPWALVQLGNSIL